MVCLNEGLVPLDVHHNVVRLTLGLQLVEYLQAPLLREEQQYTDGTKESDLTHRVLHESVYRERDADRMVSSYRSVFAVGVGHDHLPAELLHDLLDLWVVRRHDQLAELIAGSPTARGPS